MITYCFSLFLLIILHNDGLPYDTFIHACCVSLIIFTFSLLCFLFDIHFIFNYAYGCASVCMYEMRVHAQGGQRHPISP